MTQTLYVWRSSPPSTLHQATVANSTAKKMMLPSTPLKFTSIPSTTNKTPMGREANPDPNPLAIFSFNPKLDIPSSPPPREATPTAAKLPKCIAAQAYKAATSSKYPMRVCRGLFSKPVLAMRLRKRDVRK